jgi:hypothetical protein
LKSRELLNVESWKGGKGSGQRRNGKKKKWGNAEEFGTQEIRKQARGLVPSFPAFHIGLLPWAWVPDFQI